MSSSSLGLVSRKPGVSLLVRMAARVIRHWRDRAAIRYLRDLDDEALRDMGIQRHEIARVVRGR